MLERAISSSKTHFSFSQNQYILFTSDASYAGKVATVALGTVRCYSEQFRANQLVTEEDIQGIQE